MLFLEVFTFFQRKALPCYGCTSWFCWSTYLPLIWVSCLAPGFTLEKTNVFHSMLKVWPICVNTVEKLWKIMFHDFVHFPKFFQSVELLNVWNNCVVTVELNCGVTVEQMSAKNSFFSSTLWKSKFHYVEQLWNCLFHTVEQSLDQSTRNSTLWNFWLGRHKVQFHTMEQNLRFQIRGLSHATVLRQALASSEPHFIC